MKSFFSAFAAAAVFCCSLNAFAVGDGKVHMYFVDIGQGDSSLIIGPQGTSVLIDGGPSDTVTPIVEAMNDAIAAGLTDNKLDYVVCSHFHQDHLEGLEDVAAAFPGGIIQAYDRGGARSIVAFTEYDNYFGASGLNKRKFAETFSIGTGATMTYIGHPTAGEADENNNGVIYRLDFGFFKCSLGGDLGSTYEISFASAIGNVDHYKANHHGSGTSSQQAFLDVILPETHTFSYGVGNSYGHPHAETVTRLSAIGSARYDTINHAVGGPYVELIADGGATYSVNGTNYTIPGAPTVPAAPSGLSATAVSASQINLAWTDNSNNETNFVVARSTVSGGPYTDIQTLAANSTSFSDTGLAASTTYYYVVRATNGAGASANSNQASATTQAAPQPPAAPSGLAATAASTSQIDLTWTDNSTNETNFVVARSGVSGGPYTDIQTLAANTTSFSDTGLSASTTYYYVVRATNAVGASANSNQASATTQAAPQPPAAPSGLAATAVSSSQINLTWTDNSTNETNFVVARSGVSGGPYTDIQTLAANTTSFSDTGLAASTTYYYVVRATNAVGASANSNQASATTQAGAASLVINEALPAPSTGSEWVEIYNSGASSVNLSGWTLDDIIAGGSAPVALSGTIAPGAYFVYTYSSSVLNNTGDDINLINPSGAVVSSTTYGSAPSGSSWARNPDVTGAFSWDSTPSPGISNTLVVVTFTSVAGDDGQVLESSETSNVGGTINSTNTTIRVGDDNTKKQYKGILSFDTSSIPDTATITKATLKVTQNTVSSAPWSTLGALVVDAKALNFGASAALATDDFAAAAGASSVAIVPQPAGNGVQVSTQLSTSGIGQVSKTGKTQLRLRFTTDDDNDSTNDYFALYSGNSASNQPVLEIEYSN